MVVPQGDTGPHGVETQPGVRRASATAEDKVTPPDHRVFRTSSTPTNRG